MSNPDTLYEGDVDLILYFIKERGDVKKWTEWESKKHLVKHHLPRLWQAMEELEQAEKNLEYALSNVWWEYDRISG